MGISLGDLVIAKVLAENLKKKRARGTRKTAENSWLIPDPPTRSLIRFRGHEGSSGVLRFNDGCDKAFQSKPDPTIGNTIVRWRDPDLERHMWLVKYWRSPIFENL